MSRLPLLWWSWFLIVAVGDENPSSLPPSSSSSSRSPSSPFLPFIIIISLLFFFTAFLWLSVTSSTTSSRSACPSPPYALLKKGSSGEVGRSHAGIPSMFRLPLLQLFWWSWFRLVTTGDLNLLTSSSPSSS